MRSLSALFMALFCFSVSLLTGCTGTLNPVQNPGNVVTATGTSSLKGLKGIVHGGRQPIVGAHIYVYAAGLHGVAGSSGTAVSSSLLNSYSSGSFPTTKDASGNYYVTSDANGNFSLTGEYTCTANTQVYIYATGGNPGDGNNPWSTLMAVLGNCPGTSTEFASIYPFIIINEITTVAAGYAMAGYATNPLTVSSNNDTTATRGIANAFATAKNLANVAAGTALTTTPGGNGTVPQQEIGTLANALAACINSAGNAVAVTGPPAVAATYSSNCTKLFNAATTVSGTAATDTADALINLAHNPGNQAAVATIYGLPNGFSPFQPALTGATPPNDFSIAVTYTGGGLTGYAAALAVDYQGNIWTANQQDNNVSEFSPLGVPLSGSGFTDGSMNSPNAIAIDNNDNIFVTNNGSGNGGTGSNSVSKFYGDGSAYSGSPFYPVDANNSTPSSVTLESPESIAIDANNAVWVGNGYNCADSGDAFYPCANLNDSVADIANNLSTVSYEAPQSSVNTQSIAIDPVSGSWATQNNTDCVAHLVPPTSGSTLANTATCDTSGSTAQGLDGSIGIALDHNGVVWVAASNYSVLATIAGNGATPVYYTGGGLNAPFSMAIDGNGNAWTANIGGFTYTDPSSGNSTSLYSISAFTNAGAAISPPASATFGGGYQSAALNQPNDVAIDGSGNVWVSSYGSASVTEFVGAAYPVVTPLAVAVSNNTLGQQP